MDDAQYDEYTARFRNALNNDPAVLGLLALGSTTEPALRDAWSDHDFCIVTEAGAEGKYLDALDWLPDAEQILLSSRHEPAYRTVLYRNHHKIDYTVVDLEALPKRAIGRYRILIDRSNVVASQAEVALRRTRETQAVALTSSHTVQNLAILLWCACCRAKRGELLSSRHYLELAVDIFLAVLSAHNEKPGVDLLDPRRRLEHMNPALGGQLLAVLTLHTLQASAKLLEMAEAELRPLVPDADWRSVDDVRSWISHM